MWYKALMQGNDSLLYVMRGVRSVRSGITLIELLVVISIIAILIGLLLPALGRARSYSHRTVCLSNQRQLSMTFFNYASDNGVFPGAYWQGPMKEEAGDLTANDLRLLVGEREYTVGRSNSSEFGWVNHPR